MDKASRELKYQIQDQITPSPAVRATHVYNLLKNNFPELTEWDVICFAAEYTGRMSINWPWLEEIAKAFSRLIYLAHYEHGEIIKNDGTQIRPDGSAGRKDETESGIPSFISDSPKLG